MKQGRRSRNTPKPVVQYDLDGNYIRDWSSAKVACETLSLDDRVSKSGQAIGPKAICVACNMSTKGVYTDKILPGAAYGFRWAYKEIT